MIKVALITERIDIGLGGAERSSLELAEALSAAGADVTLLVAGGTASKTDNFVIAFCNDRPGKRVTLELFSARLKHHLTQNTYDIIHSTLPLDFADIYQPRGGSYAEAILQNAVSYRRPLMQWVKKSTHRLNFKRTALLNAERALFTRSNTITLAALSGYVKQQFIRHYNLEPGRIHVIPNAVNTKKTFDAEAAGELKNRITAQARGENPVIFLFAANNFRLKGLGPLMQSMIRASSEPIGRNIILAIAGDDNPNRYIDMARRHKIDSRVIFLGPLDYIQNALAAADVAILPTYYDPCSRFILEALAMAKPVITTRFNGAAERFTNGREGFIIDSPDDIESMAQAMLHLALPQNVKAAAEAIITGNFKDSLSITHHVHRLIELYENIIKAKGS